MQSSEGEFLLRKVLYDAIVLVEYSFLNPDPERAIYVPAELMKSIAMERLIVAHEAVDYFRYVKNNYISSSCLDCNGTLSENLTTGLLQGERGSEESRLLCNCIFWFTVTFSNN